MSLAEHDVARIRLDNALLLFDEFVAATVKHPDAATLRGLDRRFAERLQIQPSYWSQIKSRARQIGEKLARQFEILSHKPRGWMDEDHRGTPALVPAAATAPVAARGAPVDEDGGRVVPRDDDERFIVGLVLTYYRRHPDRARTRLLDLLGEVLVATPGPPPPPAPPPARKADDTDLWQRTRAGIAPLKRK